MHDSLTGLPNRVLFQQRLAEAIDAARERDGRIAVMLMDLDHFKEVNDTLGHHFGDQLLKEIGPRLSTVLRDDDIMARLGGDEFGVLLPDLPDDEVAFSIAGRLLEELAQPVSVEGLALDVAGSLGIAIFPTQARTRSRCCGGPTSPCTRPRKPAAATRCTRPRWTSTTPPG